VPDNFDIEHAGNTDNRCTHKANLV
jgi:hypothetical protein